MRRSLFLAALVAAFAAVLPGVGARAQTTSTSIRLALSPPRGSQWDRVARAWNNSLRESSSNAVELTLSSGPETGYLGDIGSNGIDAAMVNSLTLAALLPEIRVLDAPGATSNAAELDAARAAVATTIENDLAAHDLHLLGWVDFGDGRIFSTAPVAAPSDLAGRHVWLYPGDAVVDSMVRGAGGTAVPLPLAQVLPGLTNGSVDTIVASALAVTGLSWSPHLTHVTDRRLFPLGGATVMRRSTYLALSAADRAALDSTAATAHAALARSVRRDDARAYTALTTTGGLTEVSTSANASAWDTLESTTRSGLVGSTYSRALLTTVENAH